MIDVIVYANDKKVAGADDLETPEQALYAARTLWDEAWNGLQGLQRRVVFTVDGQTVRILTRRP